VKTLEVGNYSMKMIPLPCINIAYNWVCQKMFLVIYDKVH